MVRREKFGKLVLLAERESGSLGTESLAARLGPAGLDRLVSVVRYSPAVSGNAAAVGRLVDEARRIARWHDSGLLRLIGVGKVGPTFYLSFEYVEGRTLAAVIERCRFERFPFAADNALLVASRVGATLELLHGPPGAARLPVHGLVVPGHVVVTYAGEVKLSGVGLWPSLRDTGLIGPEETESLAPELARGEAGDVRSDVYSLGLLILHMLTLEPPRSEAISSPGGVRILGATGEREPMPESIAEILRLALAPDPSDRYASVAEMRQVIDSLLFSGELSSTTFNLAFFMHTLFRHDIEREAREAAEARSADYSEFLATSSAPVAEGGGEGATTLPAPDAAPTLEAAVASTDESAAPAAGPREPAGSGGPESAGELATAAAGDSSPRLRAPTPADSPDRAEPPSPGDSSAHLPSPAAGDSSGRLTAFPPPDSSGRRPRADRPSSDSSGRTRTARRSRATPSIGLGGGPEPAGRRGLALLGALLLALALGGGVGYVYFLERPTAPRAAPTTTLSPEAEAALARVRELEARIAELERERTAAEQAEAATAEPTAAPSATAGEGSGGAPGGDDEEARARERAEARRRALVERQRREAELRRLEEEKSAAEARLVLEQGAGGTTALATPLLPTVAPPPPTLAVPAPTPTPVERGSLVLLTDPEVTLPVLRSEPNVLYPPLARELRAEGRVVVEALIDENGQVAEARIVTPSGLHVGFEDAALRRVQGRRYAPATKRGVPVKVRINIQVNFTL